MKQSEIIEMARRAAMGMPGFTSDTKDPTGTVLEYYTRLINLATAKEREACAKLCDELHYEVDVYGAQCAAAIRARGQA